MLKRLFSRWIPVTLALLLVVSGVLGILLVYTKLSRISEQDVLQSLNKAAEQTAINLNTRMNSVEEAMQSILYDARFQESVNRTPAEETLEHQFDEIRPLRELVTYATNNRFISQVRIYLNDEKMLTREGVNFFGLTEAVATPEYNEMVSLGSAHHWIGKHQVKTLYFDDECITLGLLYRNSFWVESPNWSLLLLDVSCSMFDEIINKLKQPGSNVSVAIADKQGNVMLGSGKKELLARVLEAGQKEPWGIAGVGKENVAYVVQPLEAAEWSLVLYTDRDDLLSSQQSTRTLLTVILLGLTFLVVVLLLILSMGMYSRSVHAYIRTLHQNLKNSDAAGDPRVPAHRALFNLDRSITELLQTNKQLTEDNLKAQLREREVTLQALQAQINPHFLYNTLDSINWMAIRENATDVAEAITTLADYFRLSLSKGRSVVTLAEDAEIVRKYLALYEHRYENDYQVVWDLAENTQSCTLPKLTLQPLLENALQHGIFKRKDKCGGIVHIQSRLIKDQLVLTVSDNGPGITEPIDWSKGYGLGNVRRRLDLYFNNRYELSFANGTEGGVVVTVKVTADIQSDVK